MLILLHRREFCVVPFFLWTCREVTGCHAKYGTDEWSEVRILTPWDLQIEEDGGRALFVFMEITINNPNISH